MNINELLDQLAEFQAQKDLLDLDKQRLIDEVKIPAEVLSAQDDANKRRQKLDSEFWTQKKLNDERRELELAEIKDPEMPPDFVAVLEAAREKRREIEIKYADSLILNSKFLNSDKANLDKELQETVGNVYTQVAARKAEIIAEFGDKAAAVVDNIDKLTGEIKEAVKAEGKTVKGKAYQAVYVKGRVTWITDMLDGMIVAFPALAKARKEGEPSVTIRKV